MDNFENKMKNLSYFLRLAQHLIIQKVAGRWPSAERLYIQEVGVYIQEVGVYIQEVEERWRHVKNILLNARMSSRDVKLFEKHRQEQRQQRLRSRTPTRLWKFRMDD